MRKNTTISTLLKACLLMLLFTAAKVGLAQPCNPTWDRSKSSNCENSPIKFVANAPLQNSYEWDFGDATGTGVGTTPDFRDPSHAYKKAGTYIATFKGTGPAGNCTDTVMVTIKESPVSNLRALYNSQQCFLGNKFCFVDSSIAAKKPDGSPGKLVSVKYLFSDGKLYTINNPKGGDTICHEVIDPNGGFFDLTIEIEDANGCVTKVVKDKFIRVFPKLGVSFISSAPNACIRSIGTITNTTDTFTKLKDIASFRWDFGDTADKKGNIVVGDSVTNTDFWRGITGNGVIKHTWDVSGRKSGTYVFNGSLTVTTKYGCTEKFTFKGTATISILSPQIVAIPDSSCVSESATKFKLKDGPIAGARFLWNFGDPPSGPDNTNDKDWEPTHNYGSGPWMVSMRIRQGPCDTTVFDTIFKVGPNSAIERPFTRVPEDEKYQCIIRDSVHFTNVSSFYHTDPFPVKEDSSGVYRYYTVSSDSTVDYFEKPLKLGSIKTKQTYKGFAGVTTIFYLEKDTLESFSQSVLAPDSIIFYVKGVKVKGPVTNPIISGNDVLTIVKKKEYAFVWPGNQTAIPYPSTIPQRNKDHVLRLWDFGDNYAPKCTTDTKKNKNVGLNCNFSVDSLPVHWYTPWDQIYKYQNNGQFYATPAEKTVLCKGGRFCYKIRYFPAQSFVIPADTLVIVPKDSTFIVGNDTVRPSTPEKLTGSFRIKKVASKIKGPAIYVPTLSDETWTFHTTGKIYIKNIATGITSNNKGTGTYTLKKGDQFYLLKGDSATIQSQVVITAGRTITATPTVICRDTIINGRDTFVSRSQTFIDSNFHRENFYLKNAQCNTVRLYHEDTVHALRCKSSNQISLALLPPNAKGLEFEGIRCYAPPSPPYGLVFDVGKTKPGCTQRLLKFNFDSVQGKNNWVSHGGFLTPPLPGSAPWHLGYQLSGAYPTSFAKPYGAGDIQERNPGWVTVGVMIGNGRIVNNIVYKDTLINGLASLVKRKSLKSPYGDSTILGPECMDTVWYHNAFRYLYLDSRFQVIQPEKTQKTVCVGDTISFRLVDPRMDSVTSLVWNWNDDEGSYYEELTYYYRPYKGPSPTRNDKNINWKPTDKWLYSYVVRQNYNGFSYVVIDTIVTNIIRKWSIGVDVSRAGDALKRAFEALGLTMSEIPSADIPYFFGNGTGTGCIDTTGLGSLISFGVAPYRDALTFSHGDTWYRYTDFTKKDSTIISQKLHWRDSSQAGFDTLKQLTPNKITNLKVTPGVYRHVYKKANRYFPSLTIRNSVGCFQPRNVEVDVGFDWHWRFVNSDSLICHGEGNIVTLTDSIHYFAYEDPFQWLDPNDYWKNSTRFLNQRETKKLDFNNHDDTLPSKRFDVTGLGFPPFTYHYDDPGIYKIRIAMKDSLGCKDTAKFNVFVTGVKAGIKALLDTQQCKNIVSFLDASKVIDPCVAAKGINCDKIVDWTWDFGDGKQKSKFPNPSHDYTQNGYFTVKLTVVTQLGCVDSTSLVVFIAGPRPLFSALTDTVICVGDSISFDNESLDPLFKPLWEWDFGDGLGISDSARRPVGHRYQKAGTFEVFLTQYDNVNGSNIRCSSTYPDRDTAAQKIRWKVRVKPVAQAAFDIAPNDTICPNTEVTFTSRSDAVYTRFIWRFGDQDTLATNVTSAKHTYKGVGNYKVTMIPDYDTPEFHKCLDTQYSTITVLDVKADFDIIKDKMPDFCFVNKSTGAVKYDWVFEELPTSGTSTLKDPCYRWRDTGCYNVTLTATNAIGCVDDTTQQVCSSFVAIFVPYNVFTPEPKDGFNDVYRIKYQGLVKFDIVIYNRWGEVVFESANPDFQWNGKIKNTGPDCPEGTYFYVMNYQIKQRELNDGKPEPISGAITLLRGK